VAGRSSWVSIKTERVTAKDGEPVDKNAGASAESPYWNAEPWNPRKVGRDSHFLEPKTKYKAAKLELWRS
jgi:hypothetical protein